jgi:hypothetical protein
MIERGSCGASRSSPPTDPLRESNDASYSCHRLRAGNEVIGGSGAPGGEKDEACANARTQKVADKLK